MIDMYDIVEQEVVMDFVFMDEECVFQKEVCDWIVENYLEDLCYCNVLFKINYLDKEGMVEW